MEDTNSLYLLLKIIDKKFNNVIELFTNFDNNFDDIFSIFDDIQIVILNNKDYNYDDSLKDKIIEVFVSLSKKIDDIIDLFYTTNFDRNRDKRLSNFINVYNAFEKNLNITENDLTILY